MVARKFGVGIDLGGKQAKGMVLENLASDNAAIAKEGYVYFNTTNKKMRIYQDGEWQDYATAEELTTASGELQDAIDDINAKIGEGFDETNTVSKAIADEAERADTAEKALDDKIDDEIDRATTAEGVLQDNIDAEAERADIAEKALDDKIDDEISLARENEDLIATDLFNLGNALINSYPNNKSNGLLYNKKKFGAANEDSYTLIFNESDGGGSQYKDVAKNIVSYVGTNNGGPDGIAVQIYSKYIANDSVKEQVANSGTRLNVNPNGIYYTKGTNSSVTGDVAVVGDREVAVKQDISDLEDSIDDKLALKANSADVYTKTEIDSKMTTVFEYKGSVSIMDDLPTTGQKVGDVYNVENKVIRPADPEDPESLPVLEPWGMNVVWVGEAVDQSGQTIPAHWDELGQIIDLSPYAKTSYVDATFATKAKAAEIDGRLDTLESKVSVLESQVAALQELTAKQPKIHTYTQSAQLAVSGGVATWTIDYSSDIDSNDVQVTIKEVATGEEIVADVTQSTGQGSSVKTVTIKFETDAAIAANTYKAIIVG